MNRLPRRPFVPVKPRDLSVLEAIDENEVHVWTVDPDQCVDPAGLRGFEGLLSEDERVRRSKFVYEAGRHQYLVARALVRRTLSRYVDVEPGAWRFRIGEHGRPEIADEFGSRLRFNLSHTDGLIGCAVTLDLDVGCDVEAIDGRAETVSIAQRFFSPYEVAALRALPVEEQEGRFFVYWTLKESYIKARGLGLAIPLDQFSFHLAGEMTSITFDPALRDDPAAWQFLRMRPTERHCLAVAIRRERGVEVGIHLRPASLV